MSFASATYKSVSQEFFGRKCFAIEYLGAEGFPKREARPPCHLASEGFGVIKSHASKEAVVIGIYLPGLRHQPDRQIRMIDKVRSHPVLIVNGFSLVQNLDRLSCKARHGPTHGESRISTDHELATRRVDRAGII